MHFGWPPRGQHSSDARVEHLDRKYVRKFCLLRSQCFFVAPLGPSRTKSPPTGVWGQLQLTSKGSYPHLKVRTINRSLSLRSYSHTEHVSCFEKLGALSLLVALGPLLSSQVLLAFISRVYGSTHPNFALIIANTSPLDTNNSSGSKSSPLAINDTSMALSRP